VFTTIIVIILKTRKPC